MRVLLDTNIIIHREARKGINPDIGILFNWLDKLKATKCIHPLTVEELERNIDPETVEAMAIKLANYNTLKTLAPFDGQVKEVSDRLDNNENDIADSKILSEVYVERVDYLISEDKKIHTKAEELGISEKVFKIDTFLEKVTAENPELVDYKVLAVKKQLFGEVNLQDSFFDSFREDYAGFDKWYNKKSDEVCYVCYQEDVLSAFLFLKIEDENENYSDITPVFTQKRRLKIGTFKVTSNGFKLGERFLKIIFDNALKQKVNEIYVTIFDKTAEHERLISLLQDWGFEYHGTKSTPTGDEKVYVRNFDRAAPINLEEPKLTYPFISKESDVYVVPIYPDYHSELLPDSMLKTESPNDFVENEPHRNSLSKVYVSRAYERGMKPGDILVFYRTGDTDPKIYSGVVTTIAVVESVVTNIKDENHFLELCRKRSVFTDEKLREQWNYKPSKPFIVNFLYVASYPKKVILKWLLDNGILSLDDMPRGFKKITRESFNKIANYAWQK